MSVELVRCVPEDIETIWKMQIEAFASLLERYQDYDTSPGAEKLSKVEARFNMEGSHFFFIVASGERVGVIRISAIEGRPKRISPVFVMPEYRNKGYAQAAITAAESIFGSSDWFLDTILEEKGNCHLYEKMGYVRTGEIETVNERMHLVSYVKN